MNIYTNI